MHNPHHVPNTPAMDESSSPFGWQQPPTTMSSSGSAAWPSGEAPTTGKVGFDFSGRCTVCERVDHEESILLCDGPDCNRETHMYCLWPPLLAVPEGEWFCDLCDPLGSTAQLQAYFADIARGRAAIKLESPADYISYIDATVCPLEHWIPSIKPPQKHGLTFASPLVVGSKLLLFCPTDQRNHIGRILCRRWDAQLARWEHLAVFKR